MTDAHQDLEFGLDLNRVVMFSDAYRSIYAGDATTGDDPAARREDTG
jgi:hypothetical protein